MTMIKWIWSTVISIGEVTGCITLKGSSIRRSQGILKTEAFSILNRYLSKTRAHFRQASYRSWWWRRSIPKPLCRNIPKATIRPTWWSQSKDNPQDRRIGSMVRRRTKVIITMGLTITITLISRITWISSYRTVYLTTTIIIRITIVAIRITERGW